MRDPTTVGDCGSGSGGGGGSGSLTAKLTNDELTDVAIGTPVYSDANDGFKMAQADAGDPIGGRAAVIGLVGDVTIAAGAKGVVVFGGLLTATVDQWDARTGDVGGLVFSAVYWLDPATEGKLTRIAPSGSGQFVTRVGRAISTTELIIGVEDPIQL